MSDEVQISSNALALIGDENITSLADNNDRARLANRLYEPERNATLASYPWTFATRRAALGKLTSPLPEWEYASAYQLPADCLHVREINSPYARWKVEINSGNSKVINTDLASVSIVYTTLIEDPNRWSPLFIDAFTMRLAWKFAFPITKDKELAKLMRENYFEIMQDAKTIDGHQGSQDQMETDLLINVRGEGESFASY